MESHARGRLGEVSRGLRARLGQRWWLWACLALAGLTTNFGTAALRLGAILPSPRPLDFTSYYVSAWALRLGMSPYYWPPDLVPLVRAAHGVVGPAGPTASPPPWTWLMQAFTLLPYTAAAWVWLLIQLAMAGWCALMLLRVAGHSGWKAAVVALPVVITFGPVFLCLTSGQNGIVLLLGALLLGRHLAGAGRRVGPALAGWLLAVVAKIYPLVWLAVLPAARRRLAVMMIAALGLVLAATWLGQGSANRDYWFHFLPENRSGFEASVSADDQSVEARLILLGRTNTLGFTGRDLATRHERVWRPPWEIPMGTIRLASLVIVVGLGVAVGLVVLSQAGRYHPEGLLYLLVLFSLIPIPHIERYNHTILLPAMAWLWGHGSRYRSVAVLAYCLVGLSRLNHFWALVLSWPLGPLATGTCLYAVMLLGAAIAHRILVPRAIPAQGQ